MVGGLEVQRRLEAVLTQLQRRNAGRYEYELRYTAEQRLDAEINAEIVVNGETYYRENWHQLGHVRRDPRAARAHTRTRRRAGAPPALCPAPPLTARRRARGR